jgi:D-beta-D-heptose 7-phosphate kinase/D-beta-D-heptose 1-phosphate adenosyltransferase
MNVIGQFSHVSVLVIGDVMLDEYVWGDVQRISPEAPVPVVEFRRRSCVVGGAGNAAANIVSLGGRALLGGVIGRDIEAEQLRDELMRIGIDAHLVSSSDRPTTTKSRIIGGSQQVLRIDREDQTPIAHETESSLLEWAEDRLSSVDGVLISDYGKGVLTHKVCQGLIDLARFSNKPVVVDPKGRDYSKYMGATVVTPNALELRLAVEPLSRASGALEDDVRRLQSVLHGTAVLVTRGPDGVSLFKPDASPLHVAARQRPVFDVTGAGDTLAATMALALATGAPIEQAATAANMAAGIVVGKVGTGTVDFGELDSEMDGLRG